MEERRADGNDVVVAEHHVGGFRRQPLCHGETVEQFQAVSLGVAEMEVKVVVKVAGGVGGWDSEFWCFAVGDQVEPLDTPVSGRNESLLDSAEGGAGPGGPQGKDKRQPCPFAPNLTQVPSVDKRLSQSVQGAVADQQDCIGGTGVDRTPKGQRFQTRVKPKFFGQQDTRQCGAGAGAFIEGQRRAL